MQCASRRQSSICGQGRLWQFGWRGAVWVPQRPGPTDRPRCCWPARCSDQEPEPCSAAKTNGHGPDPPFWQDRPVGGSRHRTPCRRLTAKGRHSRHRCAERRRLAALPTGTGPETHPQRWVAMLQSARQVRLSCKVGQPGSERGRCDLSDVQGRWPIAQIRDRRTSANTRPQCQTVWPSNPAEDRDLRQIGKG